MPLPVDMINLKGISTRTDSTQLVAAWQSQRPTMDTSALTAQVSIIISYTKLLCDLNTRKL